MNKLILIALICCSINIINSEIYFSEKFDDGWRSRWVDSKWKGSEMGDVDVSSYNHRESGDDQGLKTQQDARFYASSAKFDKTFDNKGKTLVIQFSVQHPEKFDCGGAYLKFWREGQDLSAVKGGADGKPESDYNIMFGPDICGYGSKKVHAIFNYNGKNVEKTEEVKLEFGDKESVTHLYTLIVNSDNTYEIKIDNESKAKGSLENDWPLLEPKKIDDPTDKKPSDWVDEEMMDDPEDKKPAGYDDIKEKIIDPTATQPDDWDEEMDGKWEAPTIANPEYKGPWSAKRIKNPAYKGVWAPKQIDNPAFKPDDSLYHYSNTGGVGVEAWQVQGGTIFDNIIVTDSVDTANEWAEKYWKPSQAEEIESAAAAAKQKAEADAAAAKAAEAQKGAGGAPPATEEEEDDDDDEDDEKPSEKEEL